MNPEAPLPDPAPTLPATSWPPTDPAFAAFSLATGLAALTVLNFEFVPIIDHVNLAFHEFGHPLFGVFGEAMHWLGGTLMQFVFPVLTCGHFFRRGEFYASAACGYWCAENLRYVAFYVADARAQQLPLVGGGEHDWATILGWLGWLQLDTRLAAMLVFLSWTGWWLVWALVARAWWQARQQRRQEAAAAQRARVIAEARRRGRRG